MLNSEEPPKKKMKTSEYEKTSCFVEEGVNYLHDFTEGGYRINFRRVSAIYQDFIMYVTLPLIEKNEKIDDPPSYTIDMAFNDDTDEDEDLTFLSFSLNRFNDDRRSISHIMHRNRRAKERDFICHLPGDPRHFINFRKVTAFRISSTAIIQKVVKIPIYRENLIEPVKIFTLYFKESSTSDEIYFYRFCISTRCTTTEEEKKEETLQPLCDDTERSYISLVNTMTNESWGLMKREQKDVGIHLLKVCCEIKSRIDYFQSLIKDYLNILLKEEEEEKNREPAQATSRIDKSMGGSSSVLPLDDCLEKINFPYDESDFLEIAKKLLSIEIKVEHPSIE